MAGKTTGNKKDSNPKAGIIPEKEQKKGSKALKNKKSGKEKKLSKEESQKIRLETAQTFAKEISREFKKSLKAVVVYGSTAKGKHRETSDIDTFVIIDDTKLEQDIPAEVKERIGADLRRIGTKIDKNITI
ncbi:MAG: nucleotidyltransferase domain-containing protein, partial [Candidatus Aenigmarchaeota archaeon]|nr:nucleotidyltransferase domain-containing protein [Candidatus Aenigmarchaeota archaeon]